MFGGLLDAYQMEFPPSSPFHLIFYVSSVKKKVSDREALRHRRWERGRGKKQDGKTPVEWKRLLVREDILEDDIMVGQISYYFLEDKKLFYR